MQVTLEITEGPSTGEQILLSAGQTLQIGRSDRADIQCGDDWEMSSVHFAVTCEEAGCIVRDLESTNGTFVNGQRVSATLIENGDLVKAGKTVFLIHVAEDLSASPPPKARPAAQSSASPRVSAAAVPPQPSPPAASTRTEFFKPKDSGLLAADEREEGFRADTAEGVCQLYPASPELLAEVRPGQDPRAFVEVLLQKGMLLDAIHFLAQALPKRAAVWWAQECVQLGCGDQLSELDSIALEATRNWVKEPEEGNRRIAHAAAEAVDFETAASWAAMGAFWSGGSMAPPESPEIPPADHQCGSAVGGSVILASVVREPERALEKQKTFIRRALNIAGGEHPWK